MHYYHVSIMGSSMSNRLLLGLLKQIRRPGEDSSGESDTNLLQRFYQNGDKEAFARLVERYGRLVWMVCRQILANDADSEDAYQATFVVLVKSASLIRGPLAPWLHRVAYRVALKQRRRLNQQRIREQKKARKEATYPVPDSAWENLLIAVHEEVAQLPDAQRIPFVLCCLEGKPTTIAAKQVGWKLGTFSARLTLAKQKLLQRLAKRGLPLTALGLTVAMSGEATALAPSLLVLATQLAKPNVHIAQHLLFLAQGVITMKTITTKWIATALLSLSIVGAGTWLATAGQGGKGSGLPSQPREGNAAVVAGTGAGPLGAMMNGIQSTGGPGMGSAIGNEQQPHWEYLFVPVNTTTQKEYRRVFSQYEAAGWEFAGTVPEVIQKTPTGSGQSVVPGAGPGGPPGRSGGDNLGSGGGIGSDDLGSSRGFGSTVPGGSAPMVASETIITSLVFKRRNSHDAGGMLLQGLARGNGISSTGPGGGKVPGLGGIAGDTLPGSGTTNLEESDVKRLLSGSWNLSKQTVDGKDFGASAWRTLRAGSAFRRNRSQGLSFLEQRAH